MAGFLESLYANTLKPVSQRQAEALQQQANNAAAREELQRVTQNLQTAQALMPFTQQYGSPQLSEGVFNLTKVNPQLGLQQLGVLQQLQAGVRERNAQQASPMYQAQLASVRQANEQGAELFPLQKRLLQGQLAAQVATQQPAPELSEGQKMVQAWELSTGTKVPAGYRPAVNAAAGQLMLMPQEGTKEYRLAQEGQAAAQEFVGLVNEFLDDFAATGTEVGGPKASGLRQRRSRILAKYAELQNLGVLQPGEMVNLETILPDPTAWTAPFRQNETIAAPYQQLLEQAEARAKAVRERNWFLPWQPISPDEYQ